MSGRVCGAMCRHQATMTWAARSLPHGSPPAGHQARVDMVLLLLLLVVCAMAA